MGIINSSAKELIRHKLDGFSPDKNELLRRRLIRKKFVNTFPTAKIKNISAENYFLGQGKKKGCLAYELEYATKLLGSIKGGSDAKFGSKRKFPQIKEILIDLTSASDEPTLFYDKDGNLTKFSRDLVEKSKKVSGMTSGKTVLGKLLSIYYPQTFIPVFSHQRHFIKNLINSKREKAIGLELFLKDNFCLLRVRDEILKETRFSDIVKDEDVLNDVFYKFLYFCFPKSGGKSVVRKAKPNQSGEDELYWMAAQKLDGQILYTPKDKISFKVIEVTEKTLKIHYGSANERPYSRRIVCGACDVRSKGLEVNAENLRRAGVAKKKTSYSYLPAIVEAIIKVVDDLEVATRSAKRSGWGGNADPLRKVEVEKSAILKVTTYFGQKGYDVKSCEGENLGWDLNAIKGSEILKLEVKGLSNSDISFGLTPNEYRNHKDHRGNGYRICVVTKALDNPVLSVFSYSFKEDLWIDEKGKFLSFKILESAIVSA